MQSHTKTPSLMDSLTSQQAKNRSPHTTTHYRTIHPTYRKHKGCKTSTTAPNSSTNVQTPPQSVVYPLTGHPKPQPTIQHIENLINAYMKIAPHTCYQSARKTYKVTTQENFNKCRRALNFISCLNTSKNLWHTILSLVLLINMLHNNVKQRNKTLQL